MRREYRMSDDTLEELKKIARQRNPVMFLSGGQPLFDDPQELANLVWQKLGDSLHFDWESVRPLDRGLAWFTAESTETNDIVGVL